MIHFIKSVERVEDNYMILTLLNERGEEVKVLLSISDLNDWLQQIIGVFTQ